MARGEIELPSDESWLSATERQQVASIRFTKRRQEYLTRRWATKHTVAHHLGRPGTAGDHHHLASIEVRNHPSGAPWLAVDGVEHPTRVSLTDRAGWAVCLVGAPAAAGPLGIDLELVEPRSPGFVRDFLTPAEQEAVGRETTADGRDAVANLMWSAKEAALKVLQVGLREDTRSVEITLHPGDRHDGWAALGVASPAHGPFHGWWRRDGQFVLTVATRLPTDPPELLPGSADLGAAEPRHSWLANPLA